jgi:hypothetical protein
MPPQQGNGLLGFLDEAFDLGAHEISFAPSYNALMHQA